MITTKIHGLPTLPTDDLVLDGDQIRGLRFRSLHWENHPGGHHGGEVEDDGRRCWVLLTDLADERTLRITITGQDIHVDQRLEDPPRNG